MVEPADVDVDGLDRAGLASLMADLERQRVALDALRLKAAARFDALGVWADDGAASGAGWLAAQGSLSRADAARLVRDGRRLATMAETAAAVADGRLGPDTARLLARAVNERTRAAFTRDETMLVHALAPLTVDQAAMAIRYWLAHADQDGPTPDDRDTNAVWMSQTLAGRWRLKGDLDTESGAIVAGVLDDLVDAARRARRDAADTAADGPAPASRLRADALTEMARLAASGRPGATRPLLWVLTGANGTSPAELPGVGPLSAAVARRLACDAEAARITVDGEQVHLGRAVRTATVTQRRLLTLRDGGCRFPGCGRPPGWCQAHHLIFWDHGGHTDLDNLILLCSHHHHLCHEGGWKVDTNLHFYRPDGTRIEPPNAAA
jgi:hypothetical protein